MSRPAWYVSTDPLALQDTASYAAFSEQDLSTAEVSAGEPTEALVDGGAKMALTYNRIKDDDDLTQRFIDTTQLAACDHDRSQRDRIMALCLGGVRLSAPVRERLKQLSPLRVVNLPTQKISAMQLLELYLVLGRDCHVTIADDSALLKAGKLTVPEGMLQHRQMSDFLVFLNRVRVVSASSDQPLMQRITALSLRVSMATIDAFTHMGHELVPANITAIDLSNNAAVSIAETALSELSYVKQLSLADCGLEFQDGRELQALARLETLDVAGNSFTRQAFVRLAAQLPDTGASSLAGFTLEDDGGRESESSKLCSFAKQHRAAILALPATGASEEKPGAPKEDSVIEPDRFSETLWAASDYLLLKSVKYKKVENKAKSFRFFGAKDYRDLPVAKFAVIDDASLEELRGLFGDVPNWLGADGRELSESLIAAQAVAASSVFAAGQTEPANVFKQPVEFARITQLIVALERELPKMQVSFEYYQGRQLKEKSAKSMGKFNYIMQLQQGAKMLLAACYSVRAYARVITDRTEVSFGATEFAAMANCDDVIALLGGLKAAAPQVGAAEHKAAEGAHGMVHGDDDDSEVDDRPYAPLLG